MTLMILTIPPPLPDADLVLLDPHHHHHLVDPHHHHHHLTLELMITMNMIKLQIVQVLLIPLVVILITVVIVMPEIPLEIPQEIPQEILLPDLEDHHQVEVN